MSKVPGRNYRGLLAAALFLMFGLPAVFGFRAVNRPELPNFDQRAGGIVQSARSRSDRHSALASLNRKLPDAKVYFDPILDSPRWITSARGFLTGANGMGGAISTTTLARFPANEPHRITKAFLQEQSALFGHGPEVLEGARIKREFVTARNGMRTVVWEQQVDDIAVFDGLLISHVSREGNLVSVSCHFLPEPGKAASAGSFHPATRNQPEVTAMGAVMRAARDIGDTLDGNLVKIVTSEGTANQHQMLGTPQLSGTEDARLVWLPLDRNTLRLCWQIVLTGQASDQMFLVLIDAEKGGVRLRRSLTDNVSSPSYRVFIADSPTPLFPGYSAAITNQPPAGPRVLVITNAVSQVASPNGWINSGDETTSGNNVIAYLDRAGGDQPDGPLPFGYTNRIFDFPLDLTQDPISYSNACVVNLFYWNNWVHDKLYDLGFTEAAGNYQLNNFGRGGNDGDPVKAEAQYGANLNQPAFYNNSSFSSPPDGMPGILRMYLFDGPSPYRDGDFDTEVILHEYAHGMITRRVGGGAGVSALQSLGLGEGWADFYSLALLGQPTNDLNGCYPEGAYASYQLSGLQSNYYFGIRRYPYSTDMTKSPVTFRDIDPAQADPHTGVPINPILQNPATEIHNQGEVWCVALWEARANLINQYGFAAGNKLILQLVSDGLNLAPANPTFTEARDAIIQADLVETGGVNYSLLWRAFAKRGLGSGATSPISTTTTGVGESFAVPDDLLITPVVSFTTRGPLGGPFNPSSQAYRLINTSTNPMNWGAGANAPWVGLSAASGVLSASGGSTPLIISPNAAASSLPMGDYSGVVSVTNLSDGVVQILNVSLSTSLPLIYRLPLDSDPGWPREGQWAFGTPTGHGGTVAGNPDPTSGATSGSVFGVNLGGDYATTPGGPYYLTAGPFNLSGISATTLAFQRWLNSDAAPYAYATIDVSNDGTNWVNVFENDSGHVTDAAWTLCEIDISAVADNQANVLVRWGYQINTDAFAYSGWNLDDIGFIGLNQLSVSLPPFATKGQGLMSGAGTVSVAQAASSDLTVELVSSDPAKVIVPVSVVIPAGQTTAAFSLTIDDNHLLDGTESVVVSATGPGCLGGSNSFPVFDNEGATLMVVLPAGATEGDGQITGTIVSSAAPARDFAVSLVSSAPGAVQVPPFVILPAGQTNADFTATVATNLLILPNQAVTISASVTNWVTGAATIIITNNQNTNLLLTLPLQAWDSNSRLAGAGSVQIFGLLATDLVVSLISQSVGKLTVPPSVTIPAGQTSAVFDLTLIAAHAPSTPVPVTVNATASGFVGTSAVITVIDGGTPPTPFNPSPPDQSTTNPVLVTLSWSPGLGEGTELAKNGGFETGDFSGWIIWPNDGTGFVINDGTFWPPSQDGPTIPLDGDFDALAQSTPPAASLLYQDVALPTNAGTITLYWNDRIRNYNSTFAINQQFWVEIRDTNETTLATVFQTQPGDPLLGDWEQRSADVSRFAGRTIRLAFIVAAELNFLDVHLDQISLRCADVPPTTYDVYFGNEPAPGATNLIGSTTNTFWPLPELQTLTNYFWQIVARRTNATAGPIWQFGTIPTLLVTNAFQTNNASGGSLVFNVTLSAPNPDPVTVDFATADGSATAATDYASTNGTLTFNPGDTNETVTVPISAATTAPTRLFYLQLANPVNAAIGNNQTRGILYNTGGSPVLLPIANQTIHAGTTLTFKARAFDPAYPTNTLTFSLGPGAAPGATVKASSGLFTLTTGDGAVGIHPITIRGTDTLHPGLTDSITFTVTVVPRPFIHPVQLSGGQVNISWSAVPGGIYRVQSAASVTGPWSAVGGDVISVGTSVSTADFAPGPVQTFYRVMVLP